MFKQIVTVRMFPATGGRQACRQAENDEKWAPMFIVPDMVKFMLATSIETLGITTPNDVTQRKGLFAYKNTCVRSEKSSKNIASAILWLYAGIQLLKKGVQAMAIEPIQNHYPEDIAVCYGCGRNNPSGLHIQTFWQNNEGIFRYTPLPNQTAFPGVAYGGLIANLIDCHSIGTAIAATYEAEGRAPGTEPGIMYVTANLNIDYLKPTPINSELLLRAKVTKLTVKKAIVTCSLFAREIERTRSQVVAVRVSLPLNLDMV
ncbi:MAG: PaaI family thioesterase [Desulfobacterales bacterium]|nr:PaaI family thioesterase [Desulfobacterales bacterium]